MSSAQARRRSTPSPAHTYCHQTTERMARVIRRQEARSGSCDVEDLRRAGFTMAEICEFSPAASSRAEELAGTNGLGDLSAAVLVIGGAGVLWTGALSHFLATWAA
jgi:putative hemolysin